MENEEFSDDGEVQGFWELDPNNELQKDLIPLDPNHVKEGSSITLLNFAPHGGGVPEVIHT
jgi:hypothetical protein